MLQKQHSVRSPLIFKVLRVCCTFPGKCCFQVLAESAQGGGGSLSLEVLKTRSDVAPGVMVSRHGGMGRC